ncbi:MAG TPA: DUF885 family protein [Chloroflexota bacterium]|nr:DUF885 family protein [Chloroflexota bacterium]
MSSTAPHFTAWLDDALTAYLRREPVSATFIGWHEHDSHLPDLSEQGLDQAAAETRGQLRRLGELPAEQLTETEKLDRDLAQGMLEIHAWEYEGGHMWRGNPSLALGEAVFGVIALLLRPFAPWPQREEAAIARLDSVPALLEATQARIRRAPAAWIARAARECEGALALFGPGLDRFAADHGLNGERLRQAGGRACAAVTAFQRYLSGELREGGAYGCGEEALTLLIRCGHWLTEEADDILAFAEDRAREQVAYLEAHAGDFGARTWQEALGGLQELHPSVEHYLPRFEQVWTESREAAIAADLITWPEYPIRYIQQPDWAREAASNLYFLFYRAPAAFDQITPVEYLVPPIAADLPLDERTRRLEATNDSVIKLNHVIHHGGLGHHLQNYHAYRSPSRIGRIAGVDCASRIALFCGGTMTEGWACYATELMAEAGALTPLEHYAEQHSKLRMAVRTIVDIRLHRGDYRLEDAEARYRDQAGMGQGAAMAEAVKNSMFPGTALMYLMGTEHIWRLRRDLEARQAGAFSLRRFHDQFLSYGSVPVARVAAAMRKEASEAR